MLKFLAKSRQQCLSDSALQGKLRFVRKDNDIANHLNSLDVCREKMSIPPCREVHRRRVSLLVLYEANTNNSLIVILQEETYALEATCIARPAPRARNASREVFRLVPIRHASRKLKFGMQRALGFGVRGSSIRNSHGTCHIVLSSLKEKIGTA